MPNIPTIVPTKPRVRRKRRRAPIAPGPAALTLVAAVWDPDEVILVLHFSRAIDIAAIDGTLITVNDPSSTANLLNATGGAELVSEAVLQLFMVSIDAASGSEVLLNAGADTGIVAQGDGTAWAGVTDLVLPFP